MPITADEYEKDGYKIMENIIVTVKGKKAEYPQNVTFAEVAKANADLYENDIILAKVGTKIVELSKKVRESSEVDFITAAETAGMTTYTRGTILLMLRAFMGVLKEKQFRITVDHSLGNALYCTYISDEKLDSELLESVKKEMSELVKKDIPFKKTSMKTAEARELFAKQGMTDKEKLLRFRRVSNTNVYDLDGYVDYFYGYMPQSTGVLKTFDLCPYGDEGFLLILPGKEAPSQLKEYTDRPKLFATQHAANKWGSDIGIATVGDLNESVTTGSISDMILVQEAFQEKKIAEIAEKIRERGGVKFVMIAGPSSSGKTTFSHRLSIQLRTLGYKPHPIALDNYFVNREDTPKDEDGNYNFECLGAIDIEGFNDDMTRLLNGEEVAMRTFNFKTGRHEFKGDTLKLGAEDILVIEGIHGLNDKLSYTLPRESKFKVYISALTQLNIDEHNRMPTTDGRLIRRMVRDARTRGTSARNTIAMWPSVRRGEEENIFPFQEEADYMFNSALVYELAVLKQFAEPLLFGIEEDCPEYIEAKRLLKFLDYFLGISSEEIPHNSIVREFVGGSVFPV